MSDKTELDYEKMLGRLDCKPEDFLMIGNSLKSDILPVLTIGGHAIHIPYHTTWEYEKIDFEIEHDNFKSIANITSLLALLK
jgi:putative hydrolase of the HAD superfamily